MEPVICKVVGGYANCGKTGLPNYPPVICGKCGHLMRIRKEPTKRRSTFRCANRKCQARLENPPTKNP